MNIVSRIFGAVKTILSRPTQFYFILSEQKGEIFANRPISCYFDHRSRSQFKG